MAAKQYLLKSFQPKGGMCAGCKSKQKDCSSLDFGRMPVIEVDGPTAIVRCTSYQRAIGGGSSN